MTLVRLSLTVFGLAAILASTILRGAEQGPFLVAGVVKQVQLGQNDMYLADIEITQVFGGPKTLIGKEFVAASFDSYRNISNSSTIVPKLRAGETGIWALSYRSDSSLSPLLSPRGRLWPVIKGRDPDYEEVQRKASSGVDLFRLAPEPSSNRANSSKPSSDSRQTSTVAKPQTASNTEAPTPQSAREHASQPVVQDKPAIPRWLWFMSAAILVTVILAFIFRAKPK